MRVEDVVAGADLDDQDRLLPPRADEAATLLGFHGRRCHGGADSSQPEAGVAASLTTVGRLLEHLLGHRWPITA